MIKEARIDRPLVIVVLLLVLYGLIMVYSATMILAKDTYGDSFYFLKKQSIWLFIGLIILIVIASLKYPIYLSNKLVIASVLLCIVLLLMTFFTGKINNTYRWIRFLGFSLQPSEFAKITVVLYLSNILSRKHWDLRGNMTFGRLFIILMPVLSIMLLVLRSPDFGNFFIILSVTLLLLFLAGLRLRYFLYSIFFFAPLIYIFIRYFSDFRVERFTAFLRPESDMATYSFQVFQSLYAVGSGGIFGRGLGNSTQKLYFLPNAYSDFIFAIICEEMGLLGALTIILLFILFLLRGIKIANLSGNNHTYYLVSGLSYLIVLQALMNISVTIALFPTTGLTLPFVSYGGSSLVASLIITGIIINVSRYRMTVLLNE